MPKLQENQIPSYRLHKQSGQAIVTLSGRDIKLGKYGTDDKQGEVPQGHGRMARE